MNAQAWTELQGALWETGKTGPPAWGLAQLPAFLRAGNAVGSRDREVETAGALGHRKPARMSLPPGCLLCASPGLKEAESDQECLFW